MSSDPEGKAVACGPGCGCSPTAMPRRGFLALSGLTMLAAVLPAMAGPFEAADFAALVPPDKKLRPDWVRSLFARGAPAVYTKKRGELRYIGMPVGGLCCGTLYLGGDGRLWAWDIFNGNTEGILPRTVHWKGFGGERDVSPRDGASYVEPHEPQSPLDQGFALKVSGLTRRLNASGWEDVAFTGEYPLGLVTYTDPKSPVSVTLTAYTPFIPLNADDSGLPATVCEFTLKNVGKRPVEAEMGGWLENAVRLHSAHPGSGSRVNTVRQTQKATILASRFDRAPGAALPATSEPDDGTLALALLGWGVGKADAAPEAVFDAPASGDARRAAGDTLIGAVTQSVRLAPGEEKTVTYVVAWHFPNSGLNVPDAKTGNYYAKRFSDAADVAAYVAREHPRLSHDTKLWHATWYDSTLPHWFLDRAFANVSTLATTTCHRLGTGRFWGWEGVGCCEGTCTHVWHYAQAVARLFPELERDTRERVDFGVALDAGTGKIGFRGENTGPAVDGQCGRILGVYREHQMSADDGFLRRLWLRVRDAMEFLMGHDTDGDGLLEGPQDNTLDAAWYGKIPWISSLYAAALSACDGMAAEAGDGSFSRLCRQKFLQTKQAIETKLFNGEYFIQLPEPGHEKSLGVYQTCHVDQVHGQSWAWQVGLGRVLDRDKTVSALKALYKYNFAPDVGPFRRKNPDGRAYAIAGDAGLLMATNPKHLPDPFGDSAAWQHGYFNECMSGFEHQAASHMIAEGLLLEGLAVTRAVHDRYHPLRRNPYNEIECSDHYARAMASYGSFVSVCGFECHGPKRHLGFAPRLTPQDFKAAFTSAEGWGSFAQKRHGKTLKASLALKHGRLRLNTLALAGAFTTVTASKSGKSVPATVAANEGKSLVTFTPGLTLEAGQDITLALD
ncbi:MAG: hypothetical protein JO250_08910 [Armatimonadetes bacterium]|nr:hypothetical protein [Armatimonadota bacterium]